ncbi:MAG: hypothetical protein ACRDQ9_09770 [Pseudonocardiaceae bacterium]
MGQGWGWVEVVGGRASVTPLELVFVFALTQVTALMHGNRR